MCVCVPAQIKTSAELFKHAITTCRVASYIHMLFNIKLLHPWQLLDMLIWEHWSIHYFNAINMLCSYLFSCF